MRVRHSVLVALTLASSLGAAACATAIDVPAGLGEHYDAGPAQQPYEQASGGFGAVGSGGVPSIDPSSGGFAGVDESSGGFGDVATDTGGAPPTSSTGGNSGRGGSSSSSGGASSGGATDLINVPVSNKGSGGPGGGRANDSCGLSSCPVCNIALGPACCTTAGKCGCPLFWIPGTCG